MLIHQVSFSAGCVVGSVILAYAAGQLCSMIFSSGILAGVMSIVLTAVLCFWAALMGFLDVPWFWSVAPIPVVLLLATRLRTPYWLLERNTLKAWRGAVLALAVPMLVIPALVCVYRVYSVPRVDPGFNPAEFARLAAPEARATAEMYRRAQDLYASLPRDQVENSRRTVPSFKPGEPLSAAEITWLDTNEATLRLMREATERTSCDFYDPTGGLLEGRPGVDFSDLGRLLATSARRLESEGDLDTAFQRYLAALRFSAHLRQRAASPVTADAVECAVYDCLPFWAAHADQTTDRIRAAVSQVEKLTSDLPSPSDAIKSDHVLVDQIVAGDVDADQVLGSAFRVSPTEASVLYAMQALPWEKARARRVMNLFTAHELGMIDGIQSALNANRPPTLPEDRPIPIHDWKRRRLKRSTPLVNAFDHAGHLQLADRMGGYYRISASQGDYLGSELVRMETRRRAVRLQLALAGWRIEHGQLPKRLEELVGPFFETMPLDPFAAKPFEYFPEGTPQESARVPAGEPFFESTGLRRQLRSGADRDYVFRIPLDAFESVPPDKKASSFNADSGMGAAPTE
ncbi:MAG: hypothetical protein HQ582_19955 [Planctomycetes bacterium]|nr:hypothetical protein [Planctomycetota bacterium]